jgi:hypothetical protein
VDDADGALDDADGAFPPAAAPAVGEIIEPAAACGTGGTAVDEGVYGVANVTRFPTLCKPSLELPVAAAAETHAVVTDGAGDATDAGEADDRPTEKG